MSSTILTHISQITDEIVGDTIDKYCHLRRFLKHVLRNCHSLGAQSIRAIQRMLFLAAISEYLPYDSQSPTVAFAYSFC